MYGTCTGEARAGGGFACACAVFFCIGLRFRLGRVQDESTLGVLFVTS
jgi:hypothetical protein